MPETVIEWDGKNTPRELRELPPGRYEVSSLDELDPEENAAVEEGLDDIEAGRTIPFEDVVREFEARFREREGRT